MGGSCVYCGVEFIDSLTAIYCLECYNKHGEIGDCECREETGECICLPMEDNGPV